MDELDLDAIDLKKVTKTKRQECEDLIAEIKKMRAERDAKKEEMAGREMDAAVAPLGDTEVKNARYGTGCVVSCDEHYVTVRFGEVEKKFQFPNAFLQGFLTVSDDSLEGQFKKIREEEDAKHTMKQALDEINREILRSEMKLNSYLK